MEAVELAGRGLLEEVSLWCTVVTNPAEPVAHVSAVVAVHSSWPDDCIFDVLAPAGPPSLGAHEPHLSKFSSAGLLLECF